MQAAGGETQARGSVPRGSCVACISSVAPVSPLWVARRRMLFGFRSFQAGSWFVCLLSLEPFHFNGDDRFPRSTFSVLGRSRQQGKR